MHQQKALHKTELLSQSELGKFSIAMSGLNIQQQQQQQLQPHLTKTSGTKTIFKRTTSAPCRHPQT